MMNTNNKEQGMIDIVFAQRNKDYGAYAIRQTYGNTVTKSMIITTSIFLLLIGMAYQFTKKEIGPSQKEKSNETIIPNDSLKIIEVDLSKDLEKKEKVEPPKVDPPKGERPKDIAPIIKETTVDSIDKKDDPEKPITIGDPNGKPDGEPSDLEVKPKEKEGFGGIGVNDAGPVLAPEEMPEFPGGLDKVLPFLKKNTIYPQYAIESRIQQKFSVRFVVDENGYVTAPEILNAGVDPILATEAKRVINLMPRWRPGKSNNKNVKVYFTVPFQFKISN
jgi:periplasmic protein TonB